MPQLDRITIFSQIFWLFITFTAFYIILVHFYLPTFLKSLKSRQQVVERNTKELSWMTKKLFQEQILQQRVMVKNLNLIMSLFTQYFNKQLIDNTRINTTEKQFSLAVINIIKFCNLQSLNSIDLSSKSSN